jgi:hypothetical protein
MKKSLNENDCLTYQLVNQLKNSYHCNQKFITRLVKTLKTITPVAQWWRFGLMTFRSRVRILLWARVVACCWWRRKTFSDGIEFPMKLEDIKKFEKRNPHIAVNVFTIKKIKEYDEVGDLIEKDYSLRKNWRVLHRVHSKEYNRKYQIDQLFLKENDNYHYALIKNFNGFLRGNSDTAKNFCKLCLNGFRRKST